MIAKTWKRTTTFQKALALLLPVLLFRIVFMLNVGLIDDEAYHWSWTKGLSLSYFDHPGMIAWLEAITTSLFGDTLLGVRLPAFLCYLGAMVILWRLTWELFNEWAAHFAVFLLLFTPLWGIGGFVASPETPFILCWMAAAWVFWQGCREDDKRWSPAKTWLWLGVIMGLGLNSKFIMALLAPGFGVYLLMSPGRRRELAGPWPWMGVLIATLICLPIFLWNHAVDWPGFKYQFHDRHSGEGFSLARWMGWFAAQVLFLTPFVYFMIACAFFRSWFLRREARWRFLFALTVPSLLIFTVQPFFAEYKPHWAGPAYLLLTMGAGALWSEGLTLWDRPWLKPKSKAITLGILAFLVPINLFVYSTFAGPWMPKVHRFFKPNQPWNTTWDLSNEFTGWEELGQEVNRRQREIHALTDKRPFIAALRYETTAQTYWGTKQKTYHMSFTRSHYTVAQNQTKDFDNLKGLDALVVTTEKYPAQPSEWGRFDSCEPSEFKTYRGDEHARTFTIWWCKNFQGVLQ
ncbi:MAG: glycosyltransferase family 39 protein [Bdellovibrionaceae bacterium]|nr:glycosyltransferase family 39 protein [Pseudobdellovibrionaceae bacterium]MBX3034020.1 glycosyltransferase family 39 protein [Pseudobdellovibrionaceae bacterium]